MSHLVVTFENPEWILLLLLPDVISLFCQLGHSKPVRVPEDVDVGEGADGDEEEEEAEEERKNPHRAPRTRTGSDSGRGRKSG